MNFLNNIHNMNYNNKKRTLFDKNNINININKNKK